ncbi:unnamed protein product [Protopolystoma xenopodis]|uniref:Uncharacterized protein n=1 Tax=Protopolystoma xenopodis TaxID=117903 RepID=A0A3S4ZCH4_9PLAT|nr:unnamed protein product [Protopolystoma xenopodis]
MTRTRELGGQTGEKWTLESGIHHEQMILITSRNTKVGGNPIPSQKVTNTEQDYSFKPALGMQTTVSQSVT